MVGRRMKHGEKEYLYVASLRETFHDEPAKLKKIHKAMCDYRAKRITGLDVVSMMEEIMKDHWKLLLGFTVFISEVVETIHPEDNEWLGPFQTVQTRVGKRVSPVLTLDDALVYMTSVQKAFRDEPEKYEEFLRILFTAHRFDEASVIAKVEKLMTGHPSLVLGFSVFLSADPNKTIPPARKPTNNKRKRSESDGLDAVKKPKTRSQSRGR